MHHFWFFFQIFSGRDENQLSCVGVVVLAVLFSIVTYGQKSLVSLTTINTAALHTQPAVCNGTKYNCAESEERGCCQPEVWSRNFRKFQCHAK
jgi:hypothetical protein